MRSSYLKWLLPVLALILANLVYFYPALQGKTLIQDDILLGKSKSKEIVDYRESMGEEPLWTNSMFSGMPAFQLSIKYPNNFLTYVQTTIRTLLVKNSSIYIIASMMIGMFFLLRTHKVDPWIAVAGAIALGFSAFFIISMEAGHNAKVRTAVYIAPILMGVLLTLRGKHLLGFALTALMVGLSINSNHFQITYYTGFIILPILIVYGIAAFKEKAITLFVKRGLILLAAAVVGVGPNIGNIWSTMSYTKETMRGGHSALVENSPEAQNQTSTAEGLSFDYAMGWSMTKAETFNLFIPMFAGGGLKEDYTGTDVYNDLTGGRKLPAAQESQYNQLLGVIFYWGESMTNGAYYLGAVIVFLFFLGMVVVSGKTRQWVLASLIIALFLAWGKHFESLNRFLFETLPFYNKFRVPSMAVVIVCVLIPFMSFIGLQRWIELAKENKADAKKKLLLAFYITGGIAAVIFLIGPSLFDVVPDPQGLEAQIARYRLPLSLADVEDARESLMRQSALTSLLFVAATFGVLFLYNNGRLKAPVLSAAIIALVLVDLWSFDKDLLNADSFVEQREYQNEFRPSAADQFILKDTDPHFRVWNTTAPLTSDSKTSYFHKSIGGYHGAKLARYQDLIDQQLSQNNINAFNMLNTKWIIYQSNNGELLADANPQAAGNAWFPKEVLWADSPVEEMALLTDFNATQQVVVNESMRGEIENAVSTDSTLNHSIALTSYNPKELKYAANVQGGPALAVFSEIWYDAPGQPWKLYVDGNEVELHRVNYLLRSAVLPAGEHEVVMRFEPETYYAGEQINLVFSIVMILGLGGALFFEWKNKGKSEDKTVSKD